MWNPLKFGEDPRVEICGVGRISATIGAATTIAIAVFATGCRAPQHAVPQAPDLGNAMQQASCKVVSNALDPLVLEWPAADRAQLEALARVRTVAVRYDGCSLEVLPRCTLPGTYRYTPLTPRRDALHIRDEDHLWSELPLGAAKLEGSLRRSGQLDVEMAVAGRLHADGGPGTSSPTDPACVGATHWVQGVTIGAFAIYSGASSEVSGGAAVGNAGLGGRRERARKVLREDGRLDACEHADSSASEPPHGCGGSLRVELAKIGGHIEPETAEQIATHERAGRHWQRTRTATTATAAVTGAGTLAALTFVVARSLQISSAEIDRDMASFGATGLFATEGDAAELERIDREIAGLKRDRRTAGITTGALLVSTVAFATIAAVAGKHARKQTRDAKELRARATVSPVASVSHAGLSVSGRF